MLTMGSDIIFHYGPRKCGKSIFVEKELAHFKKRIYVGTLPVIAQFYETIQDHKARRDNGWINFEVSNSIEQDCQKLLNLMNDDPDIGACMIDGLITWYKNLNEYKLVPTTAQYFLEVIYKFISLTPVTLRLVDVDIIIFERNDPYWNDYQFLHKGIVNHPLITKIVDWNYE